MTPSLCKSFPGRQSAFSLVEVVLAVGVVAFAFVAILGLIPAGLTQFRQSVDTSVGAQIAQRCLMDAEQTDFNTLIDYANTSTKALPFSFRAPTSTASDAASLQGVNPGPCIRYFTEEGNEVIPAAWTANNKATDPTAAELSMIVYYVNTRVMVATELPQNATTSAAAAAYTPSLASILVQIAYNPGHLHIPISPAAAVPPLTPLGFDVSKLPGVKVRTYSAQVGRNF